MSRQTAFAQENPAQHYSGISSPYSALPQSEKPISRMAEMEKMTRKED